MQEEPKTMLVHPEFVKMHEKMIEEERKFNEIFTPAGLMSLFFREVKKDE